MIQWECWSIHGIIRSREWKGWIEKECSFLVCLFWPNQLLTLFAYNHATGVDLLLIMPIPTTLLLLRTNGSSNCGYTWLCDDEMRYKAYNWNGIPKEFSYTTSSDGYRGDNNAPLPWLRPASSVIVVSSSSTSISFPFSPADCGWCCCCCSWRWYGNPVLTINGMLYLPIGCTPNTFLIPTASYPSMGQVAKPWDVQDNIYVIATSMVFFWDHVWEVWRVGNNCMWRWASRLENNRVGMDLVLSLLPSEESKRRCCMEYNHLIIAPSIDTPNRTKKENGTDRDDGRGYPLEKSRMSSRTLSNSLADSERRLRDDVDDIVVDLVGVIVVSVNVTFLFKPASSSFVSSATESPFTFWLTCLFKKSIYRRPSHPTPTSAKNIAVQSESRTRSAFRPRQYCATFSLSFCECTSIIR